MKTLICTLALVLGCGISTQAAAVGRLVDLSVYDRTTQQNLPVYRHGGRYYVAGQPGHRYQIRIDNRQGDRVLGVLSVDGVNAISGDTADVSQSGYVLDARESSDIRGWRKSKDQVAGFVFANFGQSYAVRTGRPDNVGVIGLAVFRAKVPPVVVYEKRSWERAGDARSDKSAATASSPASALGSRSSSAAEALADTAGPLGTGHGRRENSTVSYTDFERASSSPDEVITLYYDTRERLVAKGVIPRSRIVPKVVPDPFPSSRFVPDP